MTLAPESLTPRIARALERQAQEESLEAVVRELIAQYGEPSSKDKAWAKRVLKRRKRG